MVGGIDEIAIRRKVKSLKNKEATHEAEFECDGSKSGLKGRKVW